MALLPLAAGCTNSPPSRFFTLAPRPPTKANSVSTTVIIKGVELAKYLDRPQIVSRSDSYELKVSEFERWGESMRDMVTRVLVENLSLRLPQSQVFAASGSLTMHAEVTVELDISRFDADPDGAVVLAARWAVRRGEHAASSHAQQFRVPAPSPTVTALVATMSDAFGQLSDLIAVDVVA